MNALMDNPLFGIIISIITYEIGMYVYKKTKLAIFNPLLISVVLTIAFLLQFNIQFEVYHKGGELISIFLGPATVILAVPLYKQMELLKANLVPILAGIVSGSITSVGSVILFSKLLHLERTILVSLIPKSITTPAGIEVSKQLGGIPAITVAAIIITGIVGAVMGPFFCKILRITDRIAFGIAMGTSAHVLGTTKAVEIGEVEGAMSGLSIGVAALVTVAIAVFC